MSTCEAPAGPETGPFPLLPPGPRLTLPEGGGSYTDRPRDAALLEALIEAL
jgi:hypothetical protein